eukprot:4627456-Amphidinium_carterae.1
MPISGTLLDPCAWFSDNGAHQTLAAMAMHQLDRLRHSRIGFLKLRNTNVWTLTKGTLITSSCEDPDAADQSQQLS